MSWVDAAIKAAKALEPAVLVTVIAAEGSSPRETGAKMLVLKDRFVGTIGGGGLELRVLETARGFFEKDVSPQFEDIPLGPDLGQCCGGFVHLVYEKIGRGSLGWLWDWLRAEQGISPGVLVSRFEDGGSKEWRAQPVEVSSTHFDAKTRVLTEEVRRERLPVWIFGAGHVGQAVASVLATLDYEVTVVDEREEWLGRLDASKVTPLFSLVPEGDVARIPAGGTVLVMTPTHALDFDICAAALARDDLPFVGMIGSRSKRAQALRYFASQNIPEAALKRFFSPIGLSGLRDKRPAAIAVSVAAQLLQFNLQMAENLEEVWQ
ncbi:MAG: xanthine dehydrogenase accessory protein XdhC [Alphaproteobacteria bacterium]|nr:MAG: xanthine dehydrogenase accessory protein XdhC [Alphaproteobacteria bacterium]